MQLWNYNMLTPWKESYDQSRKHIQKQRHYFIIKGPYSQGYGFFQWSYMVVSWTIKKAECRKIDAFELWYWRRLLSPFDSKEIQPVHPKGDQSWVFIGRTDVEAEAPILWPPDMKSWLIGKDTDDGKDWGQEEKGTTEDEMIGWHHWLNGHEFGWTPGVGDGRQGGLVCCGSWGHRVGYDWVTELNWARLITIWNKRLNFW